MYIYYCNKLDICWDFIIWVRAYCLEWWDSMGSTISHSRLAIYHNYSRKHISTPEQKKVVFESSNDRFVCSWFLCKLEWNSYLVSIWTSIWLAKRRTEHLSRQSGHYGLESIV